MIETQLRQLLDDFTIEELLEQGGLSPEEALTILFYAGHLDIQHLLPEYEDGMGSEEAS